jgi:hypothetical protein
MSSGADSNQGLTALQIYLPLSQRIFKISCLFKKEPYLKNIKLFNKKP